MYVYILIQEEANVKPSSQSICGVKPTCNGDPQFSLFRAVSNGRQRLHLTH